jgi:hypothetical protein
MPFLFSLCDRISPFQQITEMSQNLPRSSGAFINAKINKVAWRTAEDLAGPVGKRGESVAKQLASGGIILVSRGHVGNAITSGRQ